MRSTSDEIDPRSDRRRIEARELEDAWARVRPILDDALEVEAVTYLRAHRHAFRVRVEQAERAVAYWQMVTADRDGDAVVARERALGALKHVIEYADWWNQLISSVRRSALPDPKLKRGRWSDPL